MIMITIKEEDEYKPQVFNIVITINPIITIITIIIIIIIISIINITIINMIMITVRIFLMIIDKGGGGEV